MARTGDSGETGRQSGVAYRVLTGGRDNRRDMVDIQTGVTGLGDALTTFVVAVVEEMDRVEVVGEGDSVQDAIDAGDNHVYVSPGYDPDVEDYPVVYDGDGAITIEGFGPGVSEFGPADEATVPALDITGDAHRSYQTTPTVRGLSIRGGSPGIRLRASPFATVEDVFLNADGHGAVIADGEGRGGSFGVTFRNAQAWNCGGDGFRLQSGANPHGTRWIGCNATANQGVGVRVRGYNCSFSGGVIQLNHGIGVGVRSPSFTLENTYVEGNSRHGEPENDGYRPVELYAKNAHGLTVDGCYFHGLNPRGAAHDFRRVFRGVNVHDSGNVSVRDCVVRRYEDAFLAAFGCEEFDVYASTHYIMDETPLIAGASGAAFLSHGTARNA